MPGSKYDKSTKELFKEFVDSFVPHPAKGFGLIELIFLIISVACNGLQYVYHRFWKENMSLPGIVHFKNANSRETYFTLHNIKAAWKYGCGRGVKIGVIDWLFGLEQYPELYAGGVDFAANPKALNNQAEHGKWMATVLREVAPDCAIYAL